MARVLLFKHVAQVQPLEDAYRGNAWATPSPCRRRPDLPAPQFAGPDRPLAAAAAAPSPKRPAAGSAGTSPASSGGTWARARSCLNREGKASAWRSTPRRPRPTALTVDVTSNGAGSSRASTSLGTSAAPSSSSSSGVASLGPTSSGQSEEAQTVVTPSKQSLSALVAKALTEALTPAGGSKRVLRRLTSEELDREVEGLWGAAAPTGDEAAGLLPGQVLEPAPTTCRAATASSSASGTPTPSVHFESPSGTPSKTGPPCSSWQQPRTAAGAGASAAAPGTATGAAAGMFVGPGANAAGAAAAKGPPGGRPSDFNSSTSRVKGKLKRLQAMQELLRRHAEAAPREVAEELRAWHRQQQ